MSHVNPAEPDLLGAPYAGYLERIAEGIERDLAQAAPLSSPHQGAPAVQARLQAGVDRLAGDLVDLSHDVHEHPELGFEEHHAVAAVARLLAAHGHDAEIGAWGIGTALHATAGAGGPRVALLAEYDALPDIGHACGHNVICATAVGAFLALAEVVGEIGGRVELIGSPAEEGGGGKELIARAGAFEHIDVALMLHPFSADVAIHPWIGVRQVGVRYRGLSAHAAAMPFLGRNALDAVVQAYVGISHLRQHILPSDRVHGIITDGGRRPNIVPERAAASFYLRSAEPETLAELCDRAERVFRAAALATGTELSLDWDPCPIYLPVRSNGPLAGRYAENMALRGRRVLGAGVLPSFLTGSTDMGNVSVRVPGIHPLLAIAPMGVSIHNPEFTKWAASAAADRGTLDGAFALAATAADYLVDEVLRADVTADFDAAGGVVDLDELF